MQEVIMVSGAGGEILAASDFLRERIEEQAQKRAYRIVCDEVTCIDIASTVRWDNIHSSDGGSFRPFAPEEVLGSNSALCYGIETTGNALVSGSINFKHTGDLRPGLRFSVLLDDRIVAAPMVKASPWSGRGNEITGPAPMKLGSQPPGLVDFEATYLTPGFHCLWVFAPHDRPAGNLREITVSARNAQSHYASFAMIGDIHMTRSPSSEWMNRKMGCRTTRVFRDTLKKLQSDGVGLLLFGGDLTDRGTAEEFEDFANVCDTLECPALACLGNHDLFDGDTAVEAIRGPLSSLFPDGISGSLSRWGSVEIHVLGLEPLSEEPSGMEVENRQPLIVMSHHPLHNHGGISSAGFRLQDWSTERGKTSADMNGFLYLANHCHWTECSAFDGKWYVQNPAFCEWPNAYRVFYVFEHTIRWDLRQVRNRAYVAHSAIPSKRLSWMITTVPGDLGLSIPLPRL
jgi:hypothetical protein